MPRIALFTHYSSRAKNPASIQQVINLDCCSGSRRLELAASENAAYTWDPFIAASRSTLVGRPAPCCPYIDTSLLQFLRYAGQDHALVGINLAGQLRAFSFMIISQTTRRARVPETCWPSRCKCQAVVQSLRWIQARTRWCYPRQARPLRCFQYHCHKNCSVRDS